jgi:hypothetical protein
MTEKISVMADSNEQGNSRMAKLALALANDPRFTWGGYAELDVDLEFSLDLGFNGHEPKVVFRNNIVKFLCELKEPADLLTSALGKDGHLAKQVWSIQESGFSGIVLVLGDDRDVYYAAKASLKPRYPDENESEFQIRDYLNRLRDFEANSFSMHVPVFRWKDMPFERLLSTAHKALTGGNLYGYGPRPAEGERELVAASCLFKGIGHETMKNILEDYQLCFAPRNGYARPIEEIAGIGKKRAAMINPHVRMTYLNRVRA